MSNKVSNYIKQTLAFLKGDEEGQLAARNERKADSILRGQLATLENEKVNAEIALETAQDELAIAKYPTKLIGSPESYIEGIKSAREKVVKAEKHVKDIQSSIEYWTALQKEYNEQV